MAEYWISNWVGHIIWDGEAEDADDAERKAAEAGVTIPPVRTILTRTQAGEWREEKAQGVRPDG